MTGERTALPAQGLFYLTQKAFIIWRFTTTFPSFIDLYRFDVIISMPRVRLDTHADFEPDFCTAGHLLLKGSAQSIPIQ